MPNVNKIMPSSLTEGTKVYVRGKVVYSRVTKHIAGEELIKENQRRQSMNPLSVMDKPFTTITIRDAKVLYEDPTNPTLEDKYIEQRFYKTKAHSDETGKRYMLDNKSKFLPKIYQADPANPSVANSVVTQGELATGLDVTLVLRCYKPSNNFNKGFSIDSIICNEPIRYFNSADNMYDRGITFNDTEEARKQREAAEAEARAEQEKTRPNGKGFLGNTNGDPYSNTVTPAPAQPAPPRVDIPEQAMNKPEPAVAAPADTWDCSCGNKGIVGNFCNSCGKPRPTQNPFNPAGGGVGIMQGIDEIADN